MWLIWPHISIVIGGWSYLAGRQNETIIIDLKEWWNLREHVDSPMTTSAAASDSSSSPSKTTMHPVKIIATVEKNTSFDLLKFIYSASHRRLRYPHSRSRPWGPRCFLQKGGGESHAWRLPPKHISLSWLFCSSCRRNLAQEAETSGPRWGSFLPIKEFRHKFENILR